MNGMPTSTDTCWLTIAGVKAVRVLALRKVKSSKSFLSQKRHRLSIMRDRYFLIVIDSRSWWTWIFHFISAFKENLLKESILHWWETWEESTINTRMPIMEAQVAGIISWWLEMAMAHWVTVHILSQTKWLVQSVAATLLPGEHMNWLLVEIAKALRENSIHTWKRLG